MDEHDPHHPKNRAADRAEAEEMIRQSQEILRRLDEDPEMRAAFAEGGFGPEKLEEGRRILQDLVEAMEKERAAWRRVQEAEAVQKNAEQQLLSTYALHAHIARQAFKDDPEMLRRLGLDGPLPPFGLSDTEDPDDDLL